MIVIEFKMEILYQYVLELLTLGPNYLSDLMTGYTCNLFESFTNQIVFSLFDLTC